jgi:hypothetical protein
MDAATPVAAFTARRELQAYLPRRLDTFINPLVWFLSQNVDFCTGHDKTSMQSVRIYYLELLIDRTATRQFQPTAA